MRCCSAVGVLAVLAGAVTGCSDDGDDAPAVAVSEVAIVAIEIPTDPSRISFSRLGTDQPFQLEGAVDDSLSGQVAALSGLCSSDGTDGLTSRMKVKVSGALPEGKITVEVRGRDAAECANSAAEAVVQLVDKSSAFIQVRNVLPQETYLFGNVVKRA